MRKYTNRRYLDALSEKVLIFDGAMGTNLQAQGLTSNHYGGERFNGCNEYLVISYPQAVEKVHRWFLEVGVDVIETNTFRANRVTLSEYGLQDQVIEINRSAASLARRLADEYSQKISPNGKIYPRYVAGSIGPTGKLPSADDPDLSSITFDELADVYKEQTLGLIFGGVDLILIETAQDILEVKAAVFGIHQAFKESGIFLPLQVQVTLDTNGRMLLGTDISAVLAILENLSIDVIGLNCSTGPEHMREPIQYLSEHTELPISCLPNAGLPLNIDGKAIYPLQPEPFGQMLSEFVEKYQIQVVGGCCGTTPAHLEFLVKYLHGTHVKRIAKSKMPCLSSSLRAIAIHQQPPPLLIGERCNAQGSRKFKRLLLSEDYDGIVRVAREQVEQGAHALDISVALTERADEKVLMGHVVKRLAMEVDAPLVIDTTEPRVMEVALKINPGRCLLNSTHLESGREKADIVFRLAKEHNAAVLCLTIDENGMAKTAQRKLEVAERIYKIAVEEHGLPPQSLVFDPLTFTLATGDPEYELSAMETLDGIRLIKENLPGVFTSLGISNISFGFNAQARSVLNSVMLFHAIQAGLDMAIVNPAHIMAYVDIPEEQRQLADDLIFHRKPTALTEFIEYFERFGRKFNRSEQTDPIRDMSPQQRLHWRVVHRHREGVEQDIDEIIASNPNLPPHECAVSILNSILLPAMQEVGDKFGSGQLILPFVLQSAEVMKRAVTHLEKYLEKNNAVSRGTIVLATVYGDVHDIGKNLVKTILVNNGYMVIDLGKQVPKEMIITKAIEVNADAIGLSALLVSTSQQMPLIVNELQRRGLDIPVLIGGAAINRRFSWRILFTEDGTPYKAGVFYCKDAFEGLAVMNALKDPMQRFSLLEQVRRDAEREMGREVKRSRDSITKMQSKVPPSENIPIPPFWGVNVVREIPLEQVFACLPKRDLFRLSWGAKNIQGKEWECLQAEFELRLERMQRELTSEKWLTPQGIYGYFPAQSKGDELLVYDPASMNLPQPIVLEKFLFPRQSHNDFLCLADYFLPVESGKMDLVIFQVVTVGQGATDRYEYLMAEGHYTEAYFFHGLAVQIAEATAEYLHRRILLELNLPEKQGKRYSWGYPAIPDLSHHRKVFNLLPAERELDMSLTDAFQLVPEQSTAAIIVHHPRAKYFDIGESRVEQLMRQIQ